MSIETIFQSRLLFVSGKGGVGKTSFVASLACASAKKGKRVLLVEVDNIHPSFASIFGIQPNYKPTKVSDNLFISNLTWKKSLQDYLQSTIKIKTIVKMILSNPVAMIFLDATPGARELVILSKVVSLVEKWDQVIVDLPASGHALGILRVPKTAKKLMKSGPIFEVANMILNVFSQPTSNSILVSLPEDMVVNETIEFSDKLSNDVPELSKPILVLNRTSNPSLDNEECQLIDRLHHVDLDSKSEELLESVIWERDLENASKKAIQRLEGMQPNLLCFQRFGLLGGYEGGSVKVIQQMEAFLLRKAAQ